MNSPSPGRCIFSRDQSTQSKVQCQTHSPYKFVLGLNETRGTQYLAYPYNQQVRLDGYHFIPIKVATPIMSISSTPPFDVTIIGLASSSYLLLSLVNQLFEMRVNLAFSNNSRIFRMLSIHFHG